MRHDVWQTDNGLPHDVVRTVSQTPDGYLWIGMTNALAHFDGTRIVRVASQQLIGTQITGSTTTGKGQLIVATLAGVYRLDGEQLTSIAGRDAVNSVRAIAADPTGFVWIGSERGLYRMPDQGGAAVAILPGVYITTIAVGPDGAVWVGTRKGLLRFSPDGSGQPQSWLSGTSVTSVLPEVGSVLVGTDGVGLYAVHAGGTADRIYARDVGEHVMALRRDRVGDLWVGTWDRGLQLISQSSVSQPAEGLNDGTQVVALFEDREGNMWIGTRGSGLHRMRRQVVKNYTTAAGLPHSLTWSAAEAPDGTIWIGTDGGLAAVKDGKVRKYTEAEGLPSRVVTTVAAGADGTVYAGTPGRGIARIRNGKASRLMIPDAMGVTLNHVFVAHDGRLWISTMKGLFEVDGETVVRKFTKQEGLPTNGVRSVSQGPDGAVWVATSAGAVRIRGTEVMVYGRGQGLPVPNIRSVTPDERGAVWVATQGGGLCRPEGNSFRCYSREQGLPDSDIYAAMPDANGYVWITTAVGLHRIAVSEFDRVGRGEASRVRLFSLGQSEGMGTDTCTGGIQPGARLASNGVLWVPTLKGISSVDVRKPLQAQPLNPIVERLTPGGDSARNLQVEFTAPLLSGGRRVQFRYRLDGFDPDWVQVDDRRTAYYTNLPPRNYLFRLAVRNQDGDWVETADPPAFSVQPRYHETTWFRLFAACMLAGSILLFIQMRLRAAAHRRLELTRMVEERTQELEQARSRLERADRAKSNFLSFISHEIRTPLNGILAMTTLWHTFRREEEHQQALETIESCGEALLGIVNNVLDLTRIEAGRLDLEESVFSPRCLLERAVSVIGMQASKKGIDVRTTIDGPMPEAVRADGTRLRQVLLNLLGNAVKFTPQGRIELHAAGERIEGGMWRLRFSVRDSGIGIAPDLIGNLFEPFSLASTNTTRNYGGSGLGLSISQRIVRAMQGDISVTSEAGRGSTFDFHVLVEEAQPEPACNCAVAPIPGDPADSPDVLVVEDNRVNQFVAVKMLTTLGCRVEVAESGMEALRILSTPGRKVHMVFMDCMMPELDGYETTRRIRQMPGRTNLPIIAMTADAFSWSRDRAFEAGMNSYLTKPLRIEEVRRELTVWSIAAQR